MSSLLPILLLWSVAAPPGPVLTKPPALVEAVEAIYPEQALRQGLTADVRLKVTIAADGSVTEVEVVEPVGNGFDEAALAALKRFRFSPAEVDGVPAAVQIEYVYHFTLSAPPPPAEQAPPPTAILRGQLLARGSRTRVEGATVRCGDAADAKDALSGPDGRFELEVPAGECQLKAIASGYEVFETREQLQPGETTEVIYHLVPKATRFETVVRGAREKKEVVRRTLERQELQKIPGSFGDPVRVLQNFPGVARAPFISGDLIVRGANPDQTLTYLDGVEIPLLFHLLGGPSIVNAEFLERVDFFPGGFGARYGRAVGGVVDVATRRGASDTFHAVAKVDLLDASFFAEAPVGGVSVAAAARRSYVDALIPLVLPKDPQGGTLFILPRYWDYQVRVDGGARRGAAGADGGSSYSLMAFGSDDVLTVVATGGGRNRDLTLDVHTSFHRVVGTWSLRTGNATYTLTPYLGYDLGRGTFGESTFRADQYELGLREELALDVGKRVRVRTGVDVRYDAIVGSAELPVIAGTQYVAFPGAEPKAEVQEVRRTLDSFDGAAYVEADLRVGAAVLTPGLRASTAFIYGQTRWAVEPRLWMRYALQDSTALKGSVGLHAQPPEAADMDPPPFGNPKLTHEWAFQSSVGIEHRLSDAVSVDLTAYFNRRYDNVVSPGQLIANADGSITRERFANAGLGRAYGLELLVRHELTRDFFGWVAYTLNRAEERRVGAPEYLLTGNDQTHILTAVGSYRLPAGFELGARFRYVTGRPTTPLAHDADVYSVDGDRYFGTFGATRSVRFRDFQQLDLRLDKSFLFESWTLTVYLDVQNVYNAQNVEATLFDYRYRQAIEVPGIPILPVLGVKGSL